MKPRSLRAPVALTVSFALTAAALASEPGMPPPDQHGHYPGMGAPGMEMGMNWVGAGGHGMEHWQALNLTPEQQQAIRNVTSAYRPGLQALRDRGAAMREKLTGISPDDAAYGAATQEAAQNAGALASDLVTLMSQMRAELHAILTPEQRAQMKQQMEQRRQRWETWRSRARPSS